MSKIREFVFVVLALANRPPSRKVAWTMTAVWATALVLPGLSVVLNPARGLDFTIWVGWSNAICILLDSYMLYRSIRGLLWTYNFPREKSDTLAG